MIYPENSFDTQVQHWLKKVEEDVKRVSAKIPGQSILDKYPIAEEDWETKETVG